MIKVEQVSKYFGDVKAVSEVSFEVAAQETLVLLGTSGCGKTTLLKMINRLIEPTSGNILLNGENISTKKPEELRRSIGYVLQNTGLFPHYTVAENIAIVPQLLKWEKNKIESRTRELLEKLHLDQNFLSAYPNELSGGQQQRVGLARALVADPPVLLMDEPFGALDTITRSKIQAEFKGLDELKRKTIIMVTHDVQEAFFLGDRVGLMDKGSMVQMGSPADLLFNPINNFSVDFLKEQRLLLEFKAIKPLAPRNGETFELQGAVLPEDADLWFLLDELSISNADYIKIFDEQHNEIGKLGSEDLMGAFYQHKKPYRHE